MKLLLFSIRIQNTPFMLVNFIKNIIVNDSKKLRKFFRSKIYLFHTPYDSLTIPCCKGEY